MIRLQLSVELNYEISGPGADFIFNIHAARTGRQQVLSESLRINQDVPSVVETDAGNGNRYLRLHGTAGFLRVTYWATVDLNHYLAPPGPIAETPVARLPAPVLGYIYPSRYCESDRLYKFAMREFGHLPMGYGRVQAICNWVQQRTTFAPNTSNSNTSALDTLTDAAGVCRDFAHLMIALCRAINIPARFTTGIDYGADPALGPQDFHAYVEVYLDGRWYIFDPSGTAIPMGFVRFGSGRDAADAAFATIFGAVRSNAPIISIEAINGADGRLLLPTRCPEAVSTSD